MLKYLLDADVIRGMTGNDNVKKWIGSVDDSQLAVCVFTMWERRKGAESVRKKDPAAADRRLQAIDEFEDSFRDRILALDADAAKEWALFVGKNDKHRIDAGIAAIAKCHSLIVATRNIKHFEPFGVEDLLDPFRDPPFRLEVYKR
ncbi:PIN domain-containing protein [Rhizobium sp. CC1099]|uniref:PIN domain-containing protein n=1 Tax=Rhizobium sp. CC1099 TaxID=3039160 RepID=UPI0024B147B1|nr:PIN domain-containing protein [Rhizobium sp. CC1099]WFU86396.1 PIN domain-containing protein [Rhizobium sp. CC1099]